MSNLNLFILFIAMGLVIIAVVIAITTLYRQRQTMNRLNAMVDAAIEGHFLESSFDETLLSSVETKMAHYLAGSEVTANKLTEEKEKIKGLIADISHQTKTPIANILLYSQILQEHDLPKTSQECIDLLGSQAEKLAFLIEALVKISRLEAGVLVMHPEKSSIQALLEQVIEQTEPKAAAKNISISFEPTEIDACFDPKWTGEAIYNLIDNSVKYTPTGGKVHLQVKAYELFARIDITDSGIGIEEGEQAKIFTRFYRSPKVSAVEGVGVGLYLVRQIINGQKGYLKVQSAVGHGSTFSVFLPL